MRQGRLLFCCATVAMLMTVVPAVAQTTFTEGFESYITGSPVDTWTNLYWGGTSPGMMLNVVNSPSGGANGSNQYAEIFPGEPYAAHYMTNPFATPGQVVKLSYYIKADPNSNGSFEVHAGSVVPSPYDPNEIWGQYNFGQLRRGAETGNNVELDLYGTGSIGEIRSDGLIANGSWNKIEITGYTSDRAGSKGSINSFKVNNIEYAGKIMDGSGQLGWSGWTNSASVPFQLDATVGANAIATFAWPDTSAYYAIDDIKVEKLGTMPSQLPLSPTVALGGRTWNAGGGMEGDGSRYIYIDRGRIAEGGYAGGASGEAELYRIDTKDHSVTKLANRPAMYYNGDGWPMAESSGLSYIPGQGASGQIIINGAPGWVSNPDPFTWGARPVVVRYDVATNRWLVDPNQPAPIYNGAETPQGTEPGCWDGFVRATGAGNYMFATETASQGGMLIYKADNAAGSRFQNGQGVGGPPQGAVPGGDLAYDSDNGFLYHLGRAPQYLRDQSGNFAGYDYNDYRMSMTKLDTTQNFTPGVGYSWSVDPTNAGVPWAAQADIDFPLSADYWSTNGALVYLPKKLSSLYVLFCNDWGEQDVQEVRVQGGGFFIAMYNSRDLMKYDPVSGTWTLLPNYLPVAFGAGGDMAAGLILTGDTDANGVVDVNDLNNVYNNLGTGNAAGDTNGDGVVDVLDLNDVYNNLGTTNDWYTGAAPVPEPATMVLLLASGLALVRAHRRA